MSAICLLGIAIVGRRRHGWDWSVIAVTQTRMAAVGVADEDGKQTAKLQTGGSTHARIYYRCIHAAGAQ